MNKNKKFCVYEHVFPNGKRYIGITCKKPEARWENGSGYSKEHQNAMYNAIQKYGWKNIEHNILFENLTEEEAKEKEIELINEFRTYIHFDNSMGYNMTLGGEGTTGHRNNENVAIKNKERLTGKKGKDCCNSRPLLCDGKEYESLTQFKNETHVKGRINRWLNGLEPMPKCWYDKWLHYKDTDFSTITCKENKKEFYIVIDDKEFYSQSEFARYVDVSCTEVCDWVNNRLPIPKELKQRGLKIFIDNIEQKYKTVDKVIGWEYKDKKFKNLRELSEYLNINKSTLWSYLEHPHWKSAKNFLPLKDIHKITADEINLVK